MIYKYTHKENNSDLAAGRVLFSIPGASAFPIRLMSEIFQTCQSLLPVKEKLTIYDPCCGSAYHLTGLAFTHPNKISKIICSDINEDILNIAHKNLSLLNVKGIQARIDEINDLLNKYNKVSHKEAVESAKKLKEIIAFNSIETTCFRANILSEGIPHNLNNEDIDVVFADIPYENLETWHGNPSSENEVSLMLFNLSAVLKPNSLIVIASTKKQIIDHKKYTRVKKILVGKRKVSFFRLVSN